jgi:hypothetical protein
MQGPQPGQTLLSLTFRSATIFAGKVRPRIQFPALVFEEEDQHEDIVPGRAQLEVIAADREPYLGSASADYVTLVLPLQDYARLKARVTTIAEEPLGIDLVVDEYELIVAATVDGNEIVCHPHRTESGFDGGELDMDIDDLRERPGGRQRGTRKG